MALCSVVVYTVQTNADENRQLMNEDGRMSINDGFSVYCNPAFSIQHVSGHLARDPTLAYLLFHLPASI